MAGRAGDVKLGAFILAALALLVALLVVIGGGFLEKPVLRIETYVDASVTGLEEGSAVLYRGVRIGEVVNIDFADAFYDVPARQFGRFVMIRADLNNAAFEQLGSQALRGQLAEMIEEGLRFQLRAQGVTGVVLLEADFFDAADYPAPEISWEPENFYIPTVPSLFDTVTDAMTAIARNLEETDFAAIGDNVNKLLVRLDESVAQARVDEVAQAVLDAVARTEEAIVGMNDFLRRLESEQVVESMAATLQEGQATAARAGQELAAISRETQGAIGDVRALLENTQARLDAIDVEGIRVRAEKALDQLSASLERFESSARRVDGIVASNEQGIAVLLANMEEATRNLRDLSETLRQHPSLLPFGAPPQPVEDYDQLGENR